MSPDEAGSRLRGVRYGRLNLLADRRGSFVEIWRASGLANWARKRPGCPAPAFVQANISTSAPGVLRGLHYHRRQLDYWTVVSGRALVASSTCGRCWPTCSPGAGRDSGAG